MTQDEYNKLFHKEQLNLVAFKRLMDCDEEVLRLVNSAIKAALEAKDEPVAWMYDWTTEGEFIQNWTTSEAESLRDTEPNIISNVRPLYTTLPQRTWVGLTDEEIEAIVGPYGDTPIKGYTRQLFDKIEAKLKEKNNG
jgi:hypothetical protein